VSVETIKALQEDHFGRWKNREAIAETMIPMIGKLYRERNVIVHGLWPQPGQPLGHPDPEELHRRVRMIAGELSVVDTEPIMQELAAGPMSVPAASMSASWPSSTRTATRALSRRIPARRPDPPAIGKQPPSILPMWCCMALAVSAASGPPDHRAGR
jgi:hypothetical protein